MLAMRLEGLLPMSQQKTPVNFCTQLSAEEVVDIAAFDPSTNTDDALRHVTYLMLERLHPLTWN